MGLISFLKEKFSKKDNGKYNNGLEKSRSAFSKKLNDLGKKYKKVNEDYFSELEEILIEADVGVNLTLQTIDELLTKAKKEKINDYEELNSALIDILFSNYTNDTDLPTEINFDGDLPTVALIVGVNGVGKTTSIAKLANRYKNAGKKVLLVAGDTFRAGATEQLALWGDRLGLDVIVGKENSDPSSVVYDGVYKAVKENYDLVLVDTAGRLQNKNNLMMELEKIKRVIGKLVPNGPQETFLILDATTGQNGVVQAKAFNEVTKITGVVITKMDGTSKGGIILAIKNELNIPVRFIGLGEKMDDLEIFDLEKYLYGLCIGE
ncbi:MAG: signal recognition particle-docking protein FtsY [Bacilli bacterium]|nr:signal recognition particle-docking protein FtsY [Bacilli bacterium]